MEQGHCKVYKKCGGCQLDVPYENQLSFKQRTVRNLLGRYCKVLPIVGMEQYTHYRHKVSAAFGYANRHAICGVWQSSSGRIVEHDGCTLEHETALAIIKSIKGMLSKYKIKTYDEKTGKGELRFVTVRVGRASGEVLVALGTGKDFIPQGEAFAKALVMRHPEIKTVTANVSVGKLNLLLGEKEQVLYGDGHITDQLCGCSFKISARSFFQVNPIQTEKLYALAVKAANLSGKERVIDAYCGVGTIGIIASKQARQVLSVESNKDAAENAKQNAALNGCENVRVVCADAGAFMAEMAAEGETADVVFTDPPRMGCSREFLASLIKLSPKKIVYISCNPETQARDLAFLTKNGYRAENARPVDLFPYTRHVECIVSLIRE